MDTIKSAVAIAITAAAVGFWLAHPGPDGRGAPTGRAAGSAAPGHVSRGAAREAPVVSGGSRGASLALSPDPYGQYHTRMEVEGREVPALVDTGASLVSLSAAAAATFGIYPAPSDYTATMWTANGVTRAAPVDLREVHVGPLVAYNVKAVVHQPGAMAGGALLGMSFLKGLSGLSIDGGRLILRQ